MYEIELSCGHNRFYTVKRIVPKEGSYIVCPKHESREAPKVTKVHKGWSAKCEAPLCTFFREGLKGKDYIIELSRNHMEVFPDHVIGAYVAGSRRAETWFIITPRRKILQGEFPF